ncbi:MAG: methionyl-tRNA formyltransferase [Bacteroidales bacterium]|nr:methionyl-tRNA formyltransferase [Bacteroidales bacterium]
MNIIFFGTPEFAAAHLDFLVSHHISVVAVVTAPDKPAGRGKTLSQSAVKRIALQHHLPVLQPETLRSPQFLAELESFKADVFVVIAFRMLPQVVWKIPPKGTLNLHASLLPDYRGAAPINRAIMNGEKTTGLTTFFINEEIDTGKIILQQSMEIGENETFGELHDRMISVGQQLVLLTIERIETGMVEAIEQSERLKALDKIHAAPKLAKADSQINWDNSLDHIHNQIRGLSPFPGTFVHLCNENGQKIELKIYRSEIERINCEKPDFSVLTDNRTYLKVALKGGYLMLKEIQLSGKKILNIKDFLNGFKFEGHWSVCESHCQCARNGLLAQKN